MKIDEYKVPKISPPIPESMDGNYFKISQNVFYALDQYGIIGITDEKGDIIYVNKKFCEISKYSREELLGQNHRILKSGHHHPAFYDLMWKTITSGSSWTGEIKNKAKDGTFYWVEALIAPILDKEGVITEYVSLGVEITQQYQIVESLRKTSEVLSVSEQKYRHIFQDSPNLLRVTDMEGIIRDCNRSYAKKLGYAKTEVIGKSIFDHVSEESVDTMNDIFLAWKRDRRVFDREVWFKRKDGSTFPTLLSANTMYGPKGEVIGSNTIIIDMTEIYNAQKEIKAKQDIIKQQLIDLKKTDTQKDEFISMITHELKTPLTPIRGYCEMLADEDFGTLTKDQLDYIKKIESNATSLQQLIGDVLDVQKLGMKKMKFNIDEFRVDTFLLNVFEDNLSTAKKNRIKLINSTKNKITVKTDRHRLSQVFNNLINNAMSFVQQGIGRIEIGVKKDGNDVICYVIDNGHGIPKEKQKDIFKKFYQADTSHSRKHMGTGLGLSICKGIMDGLGGKIWLESEPRKGTTFYFSIPTERKK